MQPVLFAHPFSAYCWKVLIALWENGTPFDYRNLEEPGNSDEWLKASPMKRMPLLIDGEVVVPEATIIIEYLQLHHPGPRPMLPSDPKSALHVRLLDRLSDCYLMTPVQNIVSDRMRDETNRDPIAVTRARSLLDDAYKWWNSHMSARDWAAGSFGLADCATAVALFYSDWIHPIPSHLTALRDYRVRLLARPSVARAVNEARPYRAMFPFGDPGRD